MEKLGWITDSTIYCEFGAGRARLTTYLIDVTTKHSNSHFILIDRDHTRNKVYLHVI